VSSPRTIRISSGFWRTIFGSKVAGFYKFFFVHCPCWPELGTSPHPSACGTFHQHHYSSIISNLNMQAEYIFETSAHIHMEKITKSRINIRDILFYVTTTEVFIMGWKPEFSRIIVFMILILVKWQCKWTILSLSPPPVALVRKRTKNRDYGPWESVALTTRHPLYARFGTNFADKRRSLGL
jgi:hypothetical protein